MISNSYNALRKGVLPPKPRGVSPEQHAIKLQQIVEEARATQQRLRERIRSG